jgi:hemerythrin-like metal-binding protein
MTKQEIAPGVSVITIAEIGLSVLCGCPENAVKLLIAAGTVADREIAGVRCQTGPNAVLLSDLSAQNGMFCNLAEFPVLQMLYFQGLGIPGHPGNTGRKPMLIGLREQVAAQAEYISLGNYGLPSLRDIVDAGVPDEVAADRWRIKLAFAFGAIKPTEELLDLRVVDQDAIELGSGAFLRRLGINRYEFIYGQETLEADLNLAPGQRYPTSYSLPRRPLERADFAVTHIGDGDGWDPTRPCTGSLIEAAGSLYLVDAGPNIADSLEALGIGVSDLRGVFQTHAHDDHFVGLTALLASERRPVLYATRSVRATVARKFRALAGIDQVDFNNFFDFVPLAEDEWNELDGLDAMPIFSPHPVETSAFRFRRRSGAGYKVYAHMSDIAAFAVIDRMAAADPAKPGMRPELAAAVKSAYLQAADVKKLDIGGGMIHGAAADFAADSSGELLLSHLGRPLTAAEAAIGRRPDFGDVSVLIPTPAGTAAAEADAAAAPIADAPERTAFLKTLPLFGAPLSDGLRRAIASAASPRRAEAGEGLDMAEGLTVIVSGSVRLGLGRRVLEQLEPGDYFGETAVLYRTAPLLSATAAETCSLLVIPDALLSPVPLVLWRLREAFERRLTKLRAVFPFKWVSAYSVGVPELDDQHKREFALVDATVAFFRESPDASGPRPVVEELFAYAREHFRTEERLMAEAGYPRLIEHRHEHERLTATLEVLRRRADRLKAAELTDFLKDWILRHTLLVDRRYVGYLSAPRSG